MLKKLFCLVLFWGIFGFSQISYEGKVGDFAIEFVLDIDGQFANGVYMYSKYNKPIYIQGKMLNDNLILYESEGKIETAKFLFINFSKNQDQYRGMWTNLKNKSVLEVSLFMKKNQAEILQAESSDLLYFKTQKNKTENFVLAFEKKSGKLSNKTLIDCDSNGIFDISVEDYNFDGNADFSACMQSYAGPNTSKTYYLFDEKKNKFVESDFSGTSLEFDQKKKKIYETNQCCAGASIIKNVYIVRKNKMVLLEEHCYKRDEKTGDLVEKKPKNCY